MKIKKETTKDMTRMIAIVAAICLLYAVFAVVDLVETVNDGNWSVIGLTISSVIIGVFVTVSLLVLLYARKYLKIAEKPTKD